MKRRTLFLGGLTAACAGLFLNHGPPVRAEQPVEPWAKKLIEAAASQVGVTVIYDPSYSRIDFPNGDVPRERGVCTDVVIRAYRDAFGIDLQRLVNADMRAAFPAYPKTWGLSQPTATSITGACPIWRHSWNERARPFRCRTSRTTTCPAIW